MTELFDKAVLTARDLPPDMQDDIARMVLMLAGNDQPVVHLTPEEKTSFQDSLEQARKGEFATEEQVQAVWSKHGL